MIRRLILAAPLVLLAACSTAGPTPDALENTTLPYVTTTAPAPETSVSVVATLVLTEESLEEVRSRISTTGEILDTDLRFALMDEAAYDTVVAPQTGAATLSNQGALNVAAFPASRTEGVGPIHGYARDWQAADGMYSLREEAAILNDASSAKKYAQRLTSELTARGVVPVKTSVANVVFQATFRIEDAPTPEKACVSVAVASRARLVTVATFSHACTVSAGVWASLVSSYALERANADLGL